MILVAGGTGRLGSVVVARLVDRGLPVRVLTRDPARARHLEDKGVEVVVGDVRDPGSLESAVVGAEVVVSAVHGFVGPGGVSPASVDRDGNAHLTDAARAAGADVVLLSIVGAAPDSPMEQFRMKYAAEAHLRSSGVPFTIVRSTAFIDLWVALLQKTAAHSGRPVVFGRGDNPINFVCVNDVAALVERAVTDQATRGTVLEIGGPDNLTFNQFAAAVQAASGRAQQPRHVPVPVLRLVANTVGRIKPEVGRQTRAAVAMDHIDLTFDASPLHRSYPGLPVTSLAACLASAT